jgi:NTE family protein
MSVDENVPKAQRALVLQGGGALGAYEAGVLKMLTRNLRMEDKKMEKRTDCYSMSSQGHQ